METNEAKHSIHGNITKDLLLGSLLDKWPPKQSEAAVWGVTRIQSSCINIHALGHWSRERAQ